MSRSTALQASKLLNSLNYCKAPSPIPSPPLAPPLKLPMLLSPSHYLHSPSPHTVSAQTSDNLTISVQSVSSTYFIGTRLTVVAYSNHPELRIVGWERGPASDQVVSSEAYAIFTAPDGSNSRLRIASPVASDAGTYTVVARDGQNREIRKESEEIELLCELFCLRMASPAASPEFVTLCWGGTKLGSSRRAEQCRCS